MEFFKWQFIKEDISPKSIHRVLWPALVSFGNELSLVLNKHKTLTLRNLSWSNSWTPADPAQMKILWSTWIDKFIIEIESAPKSHKTRGITPLCFIGTGDDGTRRDLTLLWWRWCINIGWYPEANVAEKHKD